MTLNDALDAASRGWPVFPVKGGGKVPAVRWTEEASDDPQTIAAWLAGTSLNYGIACGPAGLVVIDEDEPGAADRLAQACGYSHLPATFTVRTGKGRHFYYRANGTPVRNGVRKVPGIDVRADGGYVVGPGSTHTTGASYEVADDRETLPLPGWLAQALNNGVAAAGGSSPSGGELVTVDTRLADEPIPDRINAGERRDTIMRRTSSMRARGVTLTEALIVASYLHQRCEQPPSEEFTWEEAAATVRDVFDRYDGPAAEDSGYLPFTPEEVEREARQLRIRAAAREKVDAEQAGPVPPFDAGTLAEVLARPADPPHRVDGLIPSAAGTLITAQRKAGKTTLALGLSRCLLTGEEFLGRFPVRPLDGAVGFLNYEVSAAQVARWADEAGVPRSRLFLVNLRGRRNPLAHPVDRARLAEELRDREVETLIVDPFGRAYTGASQNDAGEVGRFLGDLDLFARTEVGATDLILTAHAGWDGERTRGSSALEDWADSIITLTRGTAEGDEDSRYLRALGRDVEVPEDRLTYDPASRLLTVTGAGNRRQASDLARLESLLPVVVKLIEADPGITGYGLEQELRAGGEAVRKGDAAKAAAAAADRGLVFSSPGSRGSRRWFPQPSKPDLPHLPATSPGEVTTTSPTSLRGGGGGQRENDLPHDGEVAAEQLLADQLGATPIDNTKEDLP